MVSAEVGRNIGPEELKGEKLGGCGVKEEKLGCLKVKLRGEMEATERVGLTKDISKTLRTSPALA